MTYPHVVSEFETLQAVVAGASLARYGDGELRAAEGSPLKAQDASPGLAHALRRVLLDAPCLVGIPNIHSKTPKATWAKYTWTARLLKPGRQYHSSFITRPDSAPWIDTPEYWALLESLWQGKHVVLVRGSEKSLMASDLTGAASVREVLGTKQNAFAHYERVKSDVGRPELAILCMGATATVLAADLAAEGIHAVDLGLIGMFLRKHRRGQPMWMSKEEKQWQG